MAIGWLAFAFGFVFAVIALYGESKADKVETMVDVSCIKYGCPEAVKEVF